MTNREKVDHFVSEMRERGVGEFTSAPLLHRLLWLFGAPVPPPHFQAFPSLAFMAGSFFGVFFVGLMYFWQWGAMGMSLAVACLMILLSGSMFGVLLAAYYRWSARRLKLPPWDQYPTTDPNASESGDRNL